jgi:hypothetical protein
VHQYPCVELRLLADCELVCLVTPDGSTVLAFITMISLTTTNEEVKQLLDDHVVELTEATEEHIRIIT